MFWLRITTKQGLDITYRVYRRRSSMLRAGRRDSPRDARRYRTWGAWCSCSSDGSSVIFLNEEHLGVGVVSHEVFHAAVHWARKKYGDIGKLRDRRVEEQMAQFIDAGNRAFWTEWRKRKKRR